MAGAGVSSIPRELWLVEISSKLDLGSIFVLSKVSRDFHSLLADWDYREAPLSSFIRNGDVKMFLWDQEGPAPSYLTESDLQYCVPSGNVFLAKSIMDRGIRPDHSSLYWAIIEGKEDLFGLFFDAGATYQKDMAADAARKGHLNVLKEINGRGLSLGREAIMAAAEGKNMECLKYLCGLMEEDLWEGDLVEAAAASGDFSLFSSALHKVKDMGTLRRAKVSAAAISSMNFEILECLELDGIFSPPSLTEYRYSYCAAIELGKTKVVQWLLERGFGLWHDLLEVGWSGACGKCSAEYVAFAMTRGLKLTTKMFESAIRAKREPMLKFLFESKCPMDSETALAALEENNVPLFYKFVSLGVELIADHLATAVSDTGDLQLVKYLISRNCPMGDVVQLMDRAAANNKLDILKYFLEDLHYDVPASLSQSALQISFNRRVLNYLTQTRFEVDADAFRASARFGCRPPALRFAVEYGRYTATMDDVTFLARFSEFESLRFIVKRLMKTIDWHELFARLEADSGHWFDFEELSPRLEELKRFVESGKTQT